MTTITSKLQSLEAKLEHYKTSEFELNEGLQTIELELGRIQEAQRIFQELTQQIQNRVHQRITTIVSTCLSEVFEEPYTFAITFEKKRGKTEATLTFERNGNQVDPMTASGGGVIDVAAFALRLSCLTMALPKKRQILILDEPFRFLSKDLHGRVRALLEMLSTKLGIQIILVTHASTLNCGLVHDLTDFE